jgi:enterochelin esterase-like enzyme
MALIRARFFSKCLRRPVRFTAVVPFDGLFPPPRGEDGFKTMYLLHGYMGNNSTLQLEGWPVGPWAERFGMAIIMPEGENHFYVDDFARRDFYGEFIGRELVEFTRRLLPLSNKREDTVIAGLSMGGYGALRNGMKYSDVFGHVISASAANVRDEMREATDEPNAVGATRGFFASVFGDLDTVEETDRSLDGAARDLAASSRPRPDIFFGCGENDFLKYPNRHLRDTLVSLGIEHEYSESPGTHEPAFFVPFITRGLEHALPALPEAPNPFFTDKD